MVIYVIVAKALFIIKKKQFIDKKKFIKIILHEESKTFIVYITVLKALKIRIYFSQMA